MKKNEGVERKPGDVWKDERGFFVIPPVAGAEIVDLRNHNVTEHEDGALSVTPEIYVNLPGGRVWRGSLTQGEWSERE